MKGGKLTRPMAILSFLPSFNEAALHEGRKIGAGLLDFGFLVVLQ